MSKRSDCAELQYSLGAHGLPSSLHRANSDALNNLNALEQVVGTLVKYGERGRYVPYLAESWDVLEGGRLLRAKLRPDLTCEDGTPITAEGYVSGLKRVLPLLAEFPKIPAMVDLVDWAGFVRDHERLTGVIATGRYELEFRFTRMPQGLLEYLAMPYYGFYCGSNFNPDGTWKDEHAIVSSAAYRVEKFSGRDFVLKKRNGWPVVNPKCADRVHIVAGDSTATQSCSGARMELIRAFDAQETKEGDVIVRGTPTVLAAVILSPYRNGPFRDPEIRAHVARRIRDFAKSAAFASVAGNKVLGFYDDELAALAQKSHSNSGTPHSASAKLRFFFKRESFSKTEQGFVESAVLPALREMGLDAELTTAMSSTESRRERLVKHLDFDVRIARVDAGTNLVPWGIDLMFCSGLGVGFPDPSGRLCKNTRMALDDTEYAAGDYGADVERIIFEDAALIPLYRYGQAWKLSSEIDVDSITPTMSVPLFETIGIER